MSWGPNLLIKQGATLVQDASDILNEMDTQERVRLYQRLYGEPRSTESTAAEKEDRPEDWGPSETRVLRALRVDEGQTLDDLMEELPDTSSSEIIAALFQLEMQGAVKQDAGQRYIKLWC
jgi:DNA processing protein